MRLRIQGAPTSRYGRSARRSNKEDGGAAPQPFGRGGCGRSLRRSSSTMSYISSLSLLDFASQAPSANITVFIEVSTKQEGYLEDFILSRPSPLRFFEFDAIFNVPPIQTVSSGDDDEQSLVSLPFGSWEGDLQSQLFTCLGDFSP